jgi:hypothetical protein
MRTPGALTLRDAGPRVESEDVQEQHRTSCYSLVRWMDRWARAGSTSALKAPIAEEPEYLSSYLFISQPEATAGGPQSLRYTGSAVGASLVVSLAR